MTATIHYFPGTRVEMLNSKGERTGHFGTVVAAITGRKDRVHVALDSFEETGGGPLSVHTGNILPA